MKVTPEPMSLNGDFPETCESVFLRDIVSSCTEIDHATAAMTKDRRKYRVRFGSNQIWKDLRHRKEQYRKTSSCIPYCSDGRLIFRIEMLRNILPKWAPRITSHV